nr:uncharacterized protein LOC129166868 [Nothobranchius furzeri]
MRTCSHNAKTKLFVSKLQKMYHIVFFEETAEVEVVPALWVRDGTCLWPPYKTEAIQRAVRNREEPGSSWIAYNARVLYSANDFNEARRKLPLAEEQTDLQSEAEAIERPQRRRVKPSRYVQDQASSEDEAQTPGRGLPPPPAIPPVRRRFILPNNGPLVEVPPVPQLDLTNYQHVMTLGTSLRQAIDLQGHQGTQGVPVPTPSSSGGMMREESAVQVPTVCPNSSPGQWQQKDNTTCKVFMVYTHPVLTCQLQYTNTHDPHIHTNIRWFIKLNTHTHNM